MADASEARPSSSCCRCPCRRCRRSRGKLPWLRCSRCVRRTLARIMRFFEDVQILQLFGRRDAGALADPFTDLTEFADQTAGLLGTAIPVAIRRRRVQGNPSSVLRKRCRNERSGRQTVWFSRRIDLLFLHCVSEEPLDHGSRYANNYREETNP